MSLQLWIANKNYSSWSLRPWFLLKALNIPFDEQLATFVPGGSSYEKFLRFSPSGLVPCLVTADTTVWDSLAICEYIAEDYPHVWPQEKTARRKKPPVPGRALPRQKCIPGLPRCAVSAR